MTRILLWAASLLMLPVSILWWLGQLVRHLHRLRCSDIAIVDPHMVHYGNSLLTQDTARRIFPGRKVIFALVWEPGSTQNVKIGSIWTDLDVIPLRKAAFSFSVFGRYFSFPSVEILTPVLGWITPIFFSIMDSKPSFKVGLKIKNSSGDTVP